MKKSVLSGIFFLGCGLVYGSQQVDSSVHSSEPFFFPSLKQGHIVFQAGGYWSTQGKAQHINIVDLIGDTFTVTDHDDSNGLVGLGYFIDGQEQGRVQFSYGVNAFYLPKTSVSGIVIQENLFSNLSYHYSVTHYPLYAAAKAKIDLSANRLFLTLDGGIGPNFMQTGSFTEHSLDGGVTIPDNAFSGYTATTFSATVGVGMQLAEVFGKMPLECGYRFFYLGQGHFNQNTNQIVNTLQTGPAYANAVLCTMRI